MDTDETFHGSSLLSLGYNTCNRQLVVELRYNPEGRKFDSRHSHSDFLLAQSFQPHYGTAVDRNEYQGSIIRGKGGRYVGLTKLPSHITYYFKHNFCLTVFEKYSQKRTLTSPNMTSPHTPKNHQILFLLKCDLAS
jgi:hypothetical protein